MHSIDQETPKVYCSICGHELVLEKIKKQLWWAECPKDESYKSNDDYRYVYLIRVDDEGLYIRWYAKEWLKEEKDNL